MVRIYSFAWATIHTYWKRVESTLLSVIYSMWCIRECSDTFRVGLVYRKLFIYGVCAFKEIHISTVKLWTLIQGVFLVIRSVRVCGLLRRERLIPAI